MKWFKDYTQKIKELENHITFLQGENQAIRKSIEDLECNVSELNNPPKFKYGDMVTEKDIDEKPEKAYKVLSSENQHAIYGHEEVITFDTGIYLRKERAYKFKKI